MSPPRSGFWRSTAFARRMWREGRARFDESSQEFYRQVLLGTMLFEGLTDQTLAHGQGWMFTQIGKQLERLSKGKS